MKYAIDVPNPYDLNAPMIELAVFDTEAEALLFAHEHLGASNGFLNVISYIEDDETPLS